MDKQDALESLCRQGWLSKQPVAFRARLLKEASLRSLVPGQILFEAGDPVQSLIGVASGTFEVSLDHPQLQTQLLHIARPGAWFGQRAAYGDLRTRSVSIRAKVRSLAVVITRQKIEVIIQEDPIRLRSFALLSELHLEESMTAIVELSQRDTFQRACARLISLGVSHVRGSRIRTIEIPVTQDEFAGLCGISRKTLGRVLGKLKQAEVIEVHYRSIKILDLEKLSVIAAGDVTLQSASSRAVAG